MQNLLDLPKAVSALYRAYLFLAAIHLAKIKKEEII